MKNKIVSVILLAAVTAVGAGVYKILNRTYSGQCGPIVFNYAKLGFSLTGSVTSVEQSGQKIGISGVPCLYQEEK